MKLPFDIGTKLILRVVLPGALLTGICWPAITALIRILKISTSDEVALPTAILLFGWLILLLDMPIYMVMEGRRFWPDPLFRWGLDRESRRLSRLQVACQAMESSDARCVELQLRIREFPLDKLGAPCAQFPTRLGNLLRAFESYPDRKYGLDGVFVWYRIWVSVDKDLRAELDDQQASADSAIYASLACTLAVPICCTYASVRWLGAGDAWPAMPSVTVLLLLAALAAVVSHALYLASLHAQGQFGELFAAIFDQHADKLRFDGITNDLARTLDDPALLQASARDRNRAATRFLKWHRYRYTGTSTNIVVSGW